MYRKKYKFNGLEKKVFIFVSIMLILLLIDNFSFNFLNNYYLIFFLFLFIFLFRVLFNVEKSKFRYKKDLILEVLLYLLGFFIIYYLLGIIIGFARNTSYYSVYGFFRFIIPTIIYTIFREYLRYGLLSKTKNNKICLITVVLVFIVLDLTNNSIGLGTNLSKIATFKFISMVVLPTILNNVINSYVCLKAGILPNVIYSLVLNLYSYVLPIIPNPNEYIKAIIDIVNPICWGMKIKSFFDREADYYLTRDYKRQPFLSYILTFGFSFIVIYFVSGYFRYYAIVIVSDSMNPVIDRGDMVIVDQKSDFEIGDVIAYNRSGKIVVHRIVDESINQGETIYYTKGDAKSYIDDYKIYEEFIIGTVKFKIPYIGYPTIWLNELK